MGVPKKYNETVNRKRIVKSLNDLDFYKVKFNVTFSDEYEKSLRESEITGSLIESDLDVIISHDKLNKVCVKNFSALNEEDANRKINEWLESKVEKGFLTEYSIIEQISNTFYEELEEKNLLPLLNDINTEGTN